MKMRKSVFALLTGISLAAVAPAQAATFTNGDYSLNFHGISERYSLYPDPVPGLAATLDLPVNGAGTDSWTLVYQLPHHAEPPIWEKNTITHHENAQIGFCSVDGDQPCRGRARTGRDVYQR